MLKFSLMQCKRIYKVTGMSAVFSDKHREIIRVIMPDHVKQTLRLMITHLAEGEPSAYEFEKTVNVQTKEATVKEIIA